MDTKFLGRRHSWILKTVQGQTAPFAGARAQLLNIIDASTGAQSSLINATISDGCHTIIALFNRDTVLKAVPSDSPSPQWSSVAPRLKNAYITLTQYSVLPSRRLRTFNCVVVQFRYVSFGFPPLDPPLDIGQERYVREHFASPQSLAASGSSSSSSAAAASDSAEEASLSPQLPDDQEVLDILAEMLSTPPVSSASASSPSPPTPSSKRSRHDRDDDDENSNNNDDDDDDDEIIDDDSDNDNDSEQLVEADFIVSSSQEVLLEDLSLVDGVTSWQLASQMDDCSRIMSMSPFCELPRPSQLSPFRQSASQRITSWPDIEPSEAEDRLLFSLSAPADRPASPPSRFRVDIEPVVVDSRVDRRSVDEEDNSAVGRTSVSTSLNDDNDDDDNYNDDDNDDDDEDDDDDDDDDDDNEKGQQLHGERTKTHGGATETQRTDSKQEAVKRRTRRRRNKKNRPTKRQRLAARLLAVSHSLVSTPPRPSNHAEDTFSPPQQTPTRRLRAASLHPSPPLHIGFPTPDLYVPKTAPSRRRPTEPSPSSPPSSRSQSPPPFQVALPSSCSSSSESPHSPPMMRSSSTHQRRPAGIVVNPTGREVAIDYQSWL